MLLASIGGKQDVRINQSKKLRLNKEVLRRLNKEELNGAVGGLPVRDADDGTDSGYPVCWSFFCPHTYYPTEA